MEEKRHKITKKMKGKFVKIKGKIYFIDQKGLILSDVCVNDIVEAMRKLKGAIRIANHYFYD